MQKTLLLINALWLGFISSTSLAANSAFPGRQEFPDVPVLEIQQLYDDRDNVVIVDARSQYEYSTLRIKGSINLPVANKSFEQQLLALRSKSTKPIVFYCNGRSCYKSYLAVKKGQAAKVSNLFAYDAGIFEWTMAHPQEAVLLGESPVNTEHLISGNKYKSHLLDPDSFSHKASEMGSASMVLDVRDKYQRAGIGFFPGKERWVSLDNEPALRKFLDKAKQKNQTVFIYDEVGKQVRWLQYALEKHGIKNYYFMDKGAHAYYASISQWN